ncbi:uncharacterized protein FMAN_14284 [Fusarium mangiferae]|uniref:DUF7918 domain-containing protein n=1 Tax=Fusarium mangiferae TaxID=192010 RepID=A0A1L7UMK4_FUSMA|nr:uncharacterized protein FMAN_14284 [Fusarium mangiferae]CVL09007.1 uncharacterized protein FMAN_14284 [Fusarium mangiferae]
MATLPANPHIAVAVVIDGRRAQEYQPPWLLSPPESNRRHGLPIAKCYIESQSQKAFKIQCRVSPRFSFPPDTDLLLVSVFVDGHFFDSRAFPKTELGCIEEIGHRQRDPTDPSSGWYNMTFQKLTSVEDADQKTINADSQRIKTVGIIRVVVGVAKSVTRSPKAPRFDDGKRHEPLRTSRNGLAPNDLEQGLGTRFDDGESNKFLEFSQKVLVLNNLDQGHGTSYHKVDDAFDSVTLPCRNRQALGCFVFYYRPYDVLHAEDILNPNFVNHDAHGMRLSTQDDRVSIMSNGRIAIDLTRGP